MIIVGLAIKFFLLLCYKPMVSTELVMSFCFKFEWKLPIQQMISSFCIVMWYCVLNPRRAMKEQIASIEAFEFLKAFESLQLKLTSRKNQTFFNVKEKFVTYKTRVYAYINGTKHKETPWTKYGKSYSRKEKPSEDGKWLSRDH